VCFFDRACSQFAKVALPARAAQVEICYNRKMANLTVDPSCGMRWGIMNVVNVPEFWEVHELEFYWDTACQIALPKGIPISSIVMSTKLENTADKAWDKDVKTRWSANCRIILGGCLPMTTYVGKNIGSSVPLNNEPVEMFGQVRCVRVFQSPNATRSSSTIALGTWENKSDSSFHTVYTYSDLSGGAWHTRPAMDQALWRVWNRDVTPRPWTVMEIMFYTDLFCQDDRQVSGTAISSGSFFPDGCVEAGLCDPYLPNRAFDGKKARGSTLPEPGPTKWMAPCNEYTGCSAMQSWIGLDFDKLPVIVRCVRIYQPVHEGYPKWGYPTYSPSLSMQSWNGYRWEDRAEYTGLVQGDWSDTRPPSGSAWRLANYDRIPSSWQVIEVEFYDVVDCGSTTGSQRKLPGIAVDSNPALISSDQQTACWLSMASCAELAYDSDLFTGWQSDCDPCEQRRAWIGMKFKNPNAVKCFRLFQSQDVNHRVDAVDLAEWDGKDWQPRRFEAGIGGGTWNFRPAMPMSMYRLQSTAETALPWTVTGIAFYEDSVCNVPVTTASSITCGNERLKTADNAFDDAAETQWVASCSRAYPGHKGCAANVAWLGLQMDKPFVVKCMRLYQDRLRETQTTNAAMQDWDGLRWTASMTFPPFSELGGGAWQVLPGFRGSMWRFLADPAPGGDGVGLSEMAFYRNSDCTDHIPMAVPNIMPICSGFATSKEVGKKTGYTAHYYTMGELSVAEPMNAFDGDLETFWTDLGGDMSWIGLDLTTQASDVQCIRLALAGVRSLQPVSAKLQGWDGNMWATGVTIGQETLIAALPDLRGAGYQRRGAPPDSMWRLQNVHPVKTWIVYEVEFYDNTGCLRDVMKGMPIGSYKNAPIGAPSGGHGVPGWVFDGDMSTRWEADCPGGVCQPGEAWIGLNFEGQARTVRCFRIVQSGRRDSQATSVVLASWDGDRFQPEAEYRGIGGDTWNIRPAPPDTLWRVSYGARNDEVCRGSPKQSSFRSWGVNEIELFSDDACSQKLPGPKEGADVIASGTREIGTRSDVAGIGPLNAFDGDTLSTWTAQCGAGSDLNQDVDCKPGADWIGLDFNRKLGGLPVEVRCFRIHQSRGTARECCDPAESVALERWNGSDWKSVAWRHLPEARDNNGPQIILATFGRLADCPMVSAQDMGSLTIRTKWDKRARRQSKECLIPSAASVKLLAEPLCEKHPACAEAGFTGVCCPAAAGVSRCCCNYNVEGYAQVFEDELEVDADRNPISTAPVVGIELIMIRFAVVMPFLGVVAAIFLIILVAVAEPKPGCIHWVWSTFVAPAQRWMVSDKFIPRLLSPLVIRGEYDSAGASALKRSLLLIFGFVVGAFMVWVFLAWAVSEMLVRLILLGSVCISWAKSKYNPSNKASKKKLLFFLGLPLTGETHVGPEIPNVGAIFTQAIQSMVNTIILMATTVFDFILVRYALLELGAVDAKLTMKTILIQTQIPGAEIVNQIVLLAEKIFMWLLTVAFAGAPRCEGPVLLFSSMILIVIAFLLVRVLNYDYFGLLLAAKVSAKRTRPTFQKTWGVSLVTIIAATLFITLQCVMLIFGRTLSLIQLNVVAESKDWMCPYDGETISILTGRIFLLVMAFLSLLVVFLCANGHFAGKAYITEELGRKIKMDLSQLDEHRDAESDSFMRLSTGFAMIPTTMGIWVDRWNVKAYLIKERAQLYADEMSFPDICPECGFAHVPYDEMMKVQGKQLSLGWQVLPFGALIGKASEYMNNPPLLYWGSQLKCFYTAKTIDHVRSLQPRKMSAKEAVKFYFKLFLAYQKDLVLPAVRRIASVCIYAMLIYFTIHLTRDNVIEMAELMFQVFLLLCSSKAFAEGLLPVVALVILGVAMAVAKKKADKGSKPSKLPLVGQTLHGVTLGFGVAVFLYTDISFNMQMDRAIMAGAMIGAAESVFAVLFSHALELCPNSTISGGIAKVLLSFLIAIGGARLFTLEFETNQMFLTWAIIAVIVVPCTNVSFQPPGLDEEGNQLPSFLWPLLSTARCMSGTFGTIVGTVVATIVHDALKETVDFKVEGVAIGDLRRALICAVVGYAIGIAYAFTIDTTVEKRAGKWAVGVATAVAITFGLIVHWAVGIGLGTFIGSLIGTIWERKLMKEADAECFEKAELVKSGAISSADLALGSVAGMVKNNRDDISQGQMEIHGNLPTLCKALTPGAAMPRPELMDGSEFQQLQLQGHAEQEVSANNALAVFVAGESTFYNNTDSSLALQRPKTPPGRTPFAENLGNGKGPGRVQKAPKKHSLLASSKSCKGVAAVILPPGPRDAWSAGNGHDGTAQRTLQPTYANSTPASPGGVSPNRRGSSASQG